MLAWWCALSSAFTAFALALVTLVHDVLLCTHTPLNEVPHLCTTHYVVHILQVAHCRSLLCCKCVTQLTVHLSHGDLSVDSVLILPTVHCTCATIGTTPTLGRAWAYLIKKRWVSRCNHACGTIVISNKFCQLIPIWICWLISQCNTGCRHVCHTNKLENSSGLMCHSYSWFDAQTQQVAASFAILLKPRPRIIVSRQVAIAVAKLILTSDMQKVQNLQGVRSFHFFDVRKTVLSSPRHPLDFIPFTSVTVTRISERIDYLWYVVRGRSSALLQRSRRGDTPRRTYTTLACLIFARWHP